MEIGRLHPSTINTQYLTLPFLSGFLQREGPSYKPSPSPVHIDPLFLTGPVDKTRGQPNCEGCDSTLCDNPTWVGPNRGEGSVQVREVLHWVKSLSPQLSRVTFTSVSFYSALKKFVDPSWMPCGSHADGRHGRMDERVYSSHAESTTCQGYSSCPTSRTYTCYGVSRGCHAAARGLDLSLFVMSLV